MSTVRSSREGLAKQPEPVNSQVKGITAPPILAASSLPARAIHTKGEPKVTVAAPPHHDYTAVSGCLRPTDMNHGVPGDTPCICGGIAWYHGKNGVGCDDCDCESFLAAEAAMTMSATNKWYELHENRRDTPRVTVWYPSSLPYARLATLEHGCELPPTLPSGPLTAYLTVGNVEFGGPLDDLEVLFAAAQEQLEGVREYANELQGRTP